MRTNGYKCYNIKCGSCVNKTLCGEPIDVALGCVNRMVNSQTNADHIRSMNDEELAKMLWKTGRNYRAICANPVVDFKEHSVELMDWLKQTYKEEP